MAKLQKITAKVAKERFRDDKPFLICPPKIQPGPPHHLEYRVDVDRIQHWKDRGEVYAPRKGEPPFSLWLGTTHETGWAIMMSHLLLNKVGGGGDAEFYVEETGETKINSKTKARK